MEEVVFNELVTLSAATKTEDGYHLTIKLNPDHAVFAGHFPERAILPGVITLEIVKRAAQLITNRSLSMQEAKSIKFLRMVEPLRDETLDLNLGIMEDENGIHVRGSLSKNNDIYFKEIVTFVEK